MKPLQNIALLVLATTLGGAACAEPPSTDEVASVSQAACLIADAPCECGDGCGCGDCCRGCCCGNRGRECCVASVEKVKIEKHCWCVKKEKICVPKVVCPWAEGGCGLTCFNFLRKSNGCHNCGDVCCSDACCNAGGDCNAGGRLCGRQGCCYKPRCGKVKCVRDIEKKTYECEECVCKWEVRRLPPCCGCGDCCDDCCDCLAPPCGGDTLPPDGHADHPGPQPPVPFAPLPIEGPTMGGVERSPSDAVGQG